MSFDFNTNSLISWLKENAFSPEFQKETGQVFVILNIQSYEVPVFFLLRPESELLQMVAYLPYTLPKDKVGETARLLHILNKEIDMPGFGMDEKAELIFYRAVLPCPSGKVDKNLFNMHFGSTRVVCDTFMHAVAMIVSGTMSVDEVLKQAGNGPAKNGPAKSG